MCFSNGQSLHFLNKPSFNPNFGAVAIWLCFIVLYAGCPNMALREMEFEGMDWIDLAQDKYS